FATELAARLGRHDVAMEVVAMATHSPAVDDLPIDALGRSRLGADAVARLVRRARAHDVVVSNGSSSLPAAAIARTLGGPPFVARSIGDPDAWVDDRLRRARVRWALRRAARVVALWPAAARRLAELHGLDPDTIDVIPNAADAERFTPGTEAQRAAARDRLDVAGRRVVLAVGALSEEKRVDRAIDAVAALDDALLVVVGDGPERPTLERRAAERSAPVRFVGTASDPVDWYRAADVLALTSRTEGMPAVVIEAGLCGLPVVATDVGGVGEVVEHEVTGLLVDPAATAQGDLTEAIRRASNRHDEWGAAATARCRARFSLSSVAAEWATTLRSAC
ncbi:MAG: glycosyltransferase, partial [Actinomycetota bacterium]